MEGLDFNNILGEADIDGLFPDEENNEVTQEENHSSEETEENEENSETNTTTEVTPESLFEGDNTEEPESVGSGKKTEGKDKGDTATVEDNGSSPNNNFYSSIANALAVDGILLNSDEETLNKVSDAESLSEVIEAEINSRFDEKQQRILKALENGVEASDIRRYEKVLQDISNIKESSLAEESERGEQLRYNVIFQDFLNKGCTKEQADKLTRRSIDSGNDLEDAKEALLSNRDFFQKAYDKMLKEAEEEADREREQRKVKTEKMRNSFLKDQNLLGDIEVSADIRKKAFESIAKPVYKDPDTGQYLTAIQKYETEHPDDFLKYVGLVFTMTNGFKDFDGFVKGKVKKEMKKGLSALEQTLNNSRRDSGGKLKMVSSVKDDPESFLGGDFKLAL